MPKLKNNKATLQTNLGRQRGRASQSITNGNVSVPEMQSIFEAVPGLYLILKPDAPQFTIIAVSGAYNRATLTKREEIIGKGLFEVFPDNPNDPHATGVARLTASLMSVLKHKKPHKMDIQKYDIPHPEEGFEVRFWSPLNVPVLDKTGKVSHIIHSVIDVTNTIQAQEREKAAEDRAEAQEILNSRFADLSRQKDDFIGIASHELKTPVTSVKAYTQILRNRFTKAEDMKSAELARKMDLQLDKLTNLIADLLDVTKIESDKLQFNEMYFDFNELVVETVEELQRITERHKIILELGVSKTVYGDRERTSQVIANFITNAIKYSPSSDKIIVKTEAAKNNVMLRVQDFGVGISEKEQDKVFERFYRVNGNKNETYPGLGLGLYISAEIIKRQKGEIWVESEKGKGSTFCFCLPIQTTHT
jgi:signal transduction histidine kinase